MGLRATCRACSRLRDVIPLVVVMSRSSKMVTNFNGVAMCGQLLHGQGRFGSSAGNTKTGGASAYDIRIIMDRAMYGGRIFSVLVEPSKSWVWD